MKKTAKYVRYYYDISIYCLIPSDSFERRARRTVISAKKLEADYVNTLLSDLGSKLSDGIEISYSGHQVISAETRLYLVTFVACVLHRVPAAHTIASQPGISIFRVKSQYQSRIQEFYRNKIIRKLSPFYVIHSAVYSYTVSRSFVYEVYLEGGLEVQYTLTAEDLHDAEGKVTTAIDTFNANVIDELESLGWAGWPRNTARRPKNNIFHFDLSATRHFCFGEQDVIGELASIKEGMVPSEMVGLVDCNDQALREAVEGEGASLGCALDVQFSFSALKYHVCFVDYDEEVYEVHSELHP